MQARNPGVEAPAARSGEAGFTLVEALVAIIVLVFGLMAVTNLMLVAASSNTVANQGTAAVASATRIVELTKATPFANLSPPPGTGGTIVFEDPPTGTMWAVHPFLFDDLGVEVRTDWEHVESRWIEPDELELLDTVPYLKETLEAALGRGGDLRPEVGRDA